MQPFIRLICNNKPAIIATIKVANLQTSTISDSGLDTFNNWHKCQRVCNQELSVICLCHCPASLSGIIIWHFQCLWMLLLAAHKRNQVTMTYSPIYGHFSIGHIQDFKIPTYLNFTWTQACFLEICVTLTLYGIFIPYCQIPKWVEVHEDLY